MSKHKLGRTRVGVWILLYSAQQSYYGIHSNIKFKKKTTPTHYTIKPTKPINKPVLAFIPWHCELLLDKHNYFSHKGPLEDLWPNLLLEPGLASKLDVTSKLDQAPRGLVTQVLKIFQVKSEPTSAHQGANEGTALNCLSLPPCALEGHQFSSFGSPRMGRCSWKYCPMLKSPPFRFSPVASTENKNVMHNFR